MHFTAGHGRQEIAAAVRDQVTGLDAPTFQMGHPGAFELATRLVELLPGGINRVFFTNSGSECCRYSFENCDRLPSVKR